jgi:endonuclease-3
VSQRLGFTEHKDPDKIERDLMELVPKEGWFKLSYLLIEHGRAICQARTPKCEICPVSHLCPSSRV